MRGVWPRLFQGGMDMNIISSDPARSSVIKAGKYPTRRKLPYRTHAILYRGSAS